MNEPNCNSELESGLDILINSLRNPESLIYAFWLSVFLLLIISLLKYSIAKELRCGFMSQHNLGVLGLMKKNETSK